MLFFITRETEEVSTGYCVQKEDGTTDILNVESEEEWASLEKMLDEYNEEIQDKNNRNKCDTLSKKW